MQYQQFLDSLKKLGISSLRVIDNPDTWPLSEMYGPDTWLFVRGLKVLGIYTQHDDKGIIVYSSSRKRDAVKETAVKHRVSYRFVEKISRYPLL